ncbi:MAG: TnpV protein [Clostridia bacterium]|nr:TnpV protein [Clostridia bacterium]
MNTNTELPATVYDETNGLTYDLVGDYYFPRLLLPEEPEGDIGRYGRMRKRFLKEHQPDTFALMLMESTLTQHLMDIDREAKEQIELITAQLARAEGVTEDLKARDQLGWIRAVNSCRARAEEQVLQELILE